MKIGRQQMMVQALALFILNILCTQVAFAHPQKGEAVGFLTGFRHPISGLDHVLAMVAVGLWGAQLGAPAIWVLPVAFPMVMAMGGMLGLLGIPLSGIEYGIALSAILLGTAVMFEIRPRGSGGRSTRGHLCNMPWTVLTVLNFRPGKAHSSIA